MAINFQMLEKKSLLIIDDDASIRYITEIWLDNYNIQVIEGYDFSDGVFKAFVHSPDIIIIDTNLPDKSPAEIIEALKNNHIAGAIPIIFLIEGKNAFLKKQLTEIKYSCPVEKPIERMELINSIVSLLTGRFSDDEPQDTGCRVKIDHRFFDIKKLKKSAANSKKR